VAGALPRVGFTVFSGNNLAKRAERAESFTLGLAPRGADIALVYYAGRKSRKGTNFLVPVTATLAADFRHGLEAVPHWTSLCTPSRGRNA